MTEVRIATIVEGQGEVAAVPELVRRVVAEIDPGIWVNSPPPFRIGRNSLIRPGGIERAVEALVERVGPAAGVLVLLDADDDCPAKLGPELVIRAKQARSDITVATVLANREFEAWFLAAAPSLSGLRGLGPNLQRPANLETIRDCKGWLSARRTDGRSYKPSADQTALAAKFDLRMAREHAPSFDKFWRDLHRLVTKGLR
ncbi:DUF4276 family protein [Polymorphospora sp. NPDC051019]|uniref:DUF4276 family protein n=1 Tax=Polymorphospora sp. NPDC051019 TaxID=3155725 RepID=UPI00344440C0